MSAKKPTEKKQNNLKVSSDGSKEPTGRKFPIVGLGASAGGLEALKIFFSEVSEQSGMAYVVVVHMSPKQPSMMPDLLQNVTPIPVSPAEDGQRIEPNHVYVIPPDKDIAIYNGQIELLNTVKKSVAHPIDFFLRSLAQDHGNQAVAIILSGTGTDGTLGVNDIKASDGLVLVQSEKSAGYDGMPRSAIRTGLADLVLPPKEMPHKLVQYFKHPAASLGRTPPTAATPSTTGEQREWLNKIFAILRAQVGHDFSAYKINTLIRRIGRRMGLNHIDNHKTYVRYLRENPSEAESLFRELLIGVTNFFRDAESFEVLKSSVLPEVFKKMDKDTTFRAWIPGCSTGEEVYSLAIIFREILDNNPKRIKLQLFGTDIDSYAIDKAREGLFPDSIAPDVSKERRMRFFDKEGDYYRIRKEIRDCVVFSVQDVLKDPPFSRLKFLCCRNLLIYLNTEAQRNLLPLFHYTLDPGGVLVLGSSETIGGFSNLFETVDNKWKIFRCKDVPQSHRQIVNFPSGLSFVEPAYEVVPAKPDTQPADIRQLTQKAILDQFSPTAILTNAKGEILHVQGRTGRYLETPSGPPTNRILDLAREGLRIELSFALRTAKLSNKTVTRTRIPIETDGNIQMIDLHVCPQKTPRALAGHFLVVFVDIHINLKSDVSAPGGTDEPLLQSERITDLEQELQVTRENHQTVVEELESTNEELKSTNEEMQSSNEELQSTNEELESSKEELQSLNEELQTVNSELHSKVEELCEVHDDMRNLLDSTEIATIFVDADIRVRRFTPEATTIVNLIQTDIGRPLRHVVTNLNYDDMLSDINAVIKKLIPKEVEVQVVDGKWYNMRIMPYRTSNNQIDGAVLTFTSIEDQKKSLEKLEISMSEKERARELVRAIFDMNPEPMAVLGKDGRIVIANTRFSELMKISQVDVSELEFLDSRISPPAQIKLKSKLKNALKQNKDFSTVPFEVELSEGKKRFSIHGRIIKKEKNFPYRILLQFLKER